MYEDDADVFAVLKPHDSRNRARAAFRMKRNKSRFVPAKHDPNEEASGDSRESTPEGAEDDVDHLVLRFSDHLKNSLEGFQFGTDEAWCDVLLGRVGSGRSSRRHCNIVIDDNLWIWLHDSHSAGGTAVEYNDNNKIEVRTRDKWILGYAPGELPGELPYWHHQNIHVGRLAFRIEFPNHRAASAEYMENLLSFRQKCRDAVLPIGADSLESSVPSGFVLDRAIYLEVKTIGRGSFGEVVKAIKLRDGKEYALKKFFTPISPVDGAPLKRKRTNTAWVQWMTGVIHEHDIMEKNPHPNVMPVLEFLGTLEPPVLVMPYYELGSLDNLRHMADDLYNSLLLQLLCGLSHLHGRGIVHRDLKPGNILVEAPFKIIIADFGLSKSVDNGPLNTFCGTMDYIAPEVFPGASRSYGLKADIWSAACLMIKLLYTMPSSPNIKEYKAQDGRGRLQRWSEDWAEVLKDTLDGDDSDDQVIEILRHMLEPDPEKRYSADQCLEFGCANGLFRKTSTGSFELNPEGTDDENNGTVTPAVHPQPETSTPPSPESTKATPPKIFSPVETPVTKGDSTNSLVWGSFGLHVGEGEDEGEDEDERMSSPESTCNSPSAKRICYNRSIQLLREEPAEAGQPGDEQDLRAVTLRPEQETKVDVSWASLERRLVQLYREEQASSSV